MTNTDLPELIVRYLTAYNHFDVDGMLALLTTDVVFENFSGNQLTAATQNADQFRALAQQSATMFSEREQRITGFTVQLASTVVDIAYQGRLAVDVPDGPAAGTVIDLQGQSEFWFRDGLINKIVDRS